MFRIHHHFCLLVALNVFLVDHISANTVLDVRSYGAVGDGKTLDTDAIQKAFKKASKLGGYCDILLSYKESSSKNTFLSRGVQFLSDNTRLVIPEGVTFLVSDDRSSWDDDEITSVIYATKLNNLTITGNGIVDGQGLVWWQHKDDFRPKTVYAKKDVVGMLIENVTFIDPPYHCLEIYANFTEIRYVNVFAPPSSGISDDEESHNTDAVDIHGSPFWVHDVNFTTGDDNAAIHASNVLIENSYFGTGHGASIGSLGSDIYLENITIRNMIFQDTTSGFRIKTDYNAKNGQVHNVLVENAVMNSVQTTINVDMYYKCSKDDDSKCDGKATIDLYDFTFRNISAYDTTKSAGNYNCQSSAPCHEFYLEDVNHYYTKDNDEVSNYCYYISGGSNGNVSPESCFDPETLF